MMKKSESSKNGHWLLIFAGILVILCGIYCFLNGEVNLKGGTRYKIEEEPFKFYALLALNFSMGIGAMIYAIWDKMKLNSKQ